MKRFYVKHIYDQKELTNIREYLQKAVTFYPNFCEWWDEKVVPGIANRSRHVVVAFSEENTMIGFIVLKDAEEKKISTLYVDPSYREQLVGNYLIAHAMYVLQTRFPVITIPEPSVPMFQDLLTLHGFVKTAEYPDYYIEGVTEIAYNGYLPEK